MDSLAALGPDDFDEGPERDSFLVVQANKYALFSGKPKNVIAALEFFFGAERGREVDFDLCCAVLQARADVFRMRIQYEWFLRNTIFVNPFPFATRPLPVILEGPLLFHGGEIGFAAARETWVQPGIKHDELISVVCELEGCTPAECQSSLAKLDDEMLMSHEMGWYVTGRNPERVRLKWEEINGRTNRLGGSMHWSALFGRMV